LNKEKQTDFNFGQSIDIYLQQSRIELPYMAENIVYSQVDEQHALDAFSL
jgi:hypothetical protein